MQRRASLFRFGAFELDELRALLRRAGEPVELQSKPLAVLLHLLRNRDRFVPVDELLDACWRGVTVSESALHSAVKLARRALRGGPGARIESRRGRGYRFVGEVRESPASAAPLSFEAANAGAAPRDLVGRDAALRALDEALEDALAGTGCCVLLRGESGIGKTRLLEEVARRAEQRGALVATGWCQEDGDGPPLWPWRQIFRQLATGTPPGPQGAPERLALGELVPELFAVPARVAATSDEASAAEPYQLFDAASRWLESLAVERGLVLLLDDLQGADASSLGLLTFAARALAQAPVLLLAAERTPAGPRSKALENALGALSKRCQVLQLDGLERSGVETLLLQLATAPPSDESMRRVLELSGGNPFYVRELARGLSEPIDAGVPAVLQDALRARLARISQRARELLRVASVIGRTFDAATLARALGASRPELSPLLEEAEGEGLIEESGDGYRFEHAIVREAILAEQGRAQLAQVHGRVADALADAASGAEPERIARHYAEAGEGASGRVFEFSRRAGARAVEILAFESAVGHFERALAALEFEEQPDPLARFDLLLRLGRAHVGAGDGAGKALRVFLEAAEIARDRGDLAALTRAALALETIPSAWPVPDLRVVALLEEVLARRAEVEDAISVRLLCRLGYELVFAVGSFDPDAPATLARHGRPSDHIERAVRIARRLDQPEVLATLRYAELFASGSLPPEDRVALADDAARLAAQVGRPGVEAMARWQCFFLQLAIGESLATLAGAADAFAASSAARLSGGRALLLHQRASLALFAGDLERAERQLAEAVRIEERMQRVGLAVTLGLTQLVCARERGVDAASRDAIAKLLERQPRMRIYRIALADAELRLGNAAAAAEQLEELLEGGVENLPRDERGPALRAWLAELACELGDVRLASALLPELESMAERQIVSFVGGVCLGSAARHAGLAARAQGDLERAERHFARAVDANAAVGCALWLAHAEVDSARLLVARARRGDRDRARVLLDRADALAREHPLGLLRERVRLARLELQGVTPLRGRYGRR